MDMSAAHCQGIVREMSGNFRVSGEWSPCVYTLHTAVYVRHVLHPCCLWYQNSFFYCI